MKGGVYVFSVVFILLLSVSFVSAGSEEGSVRTPVVHYSFDSKTIGSYSKVKNEIPSLPWMLNDLGTPSFVQGIEGSALGLDQGDKVKIINNPGLKDLLSNNEFALSFWIKDMESLTIQKKVGRKGFRVNSDRDGNLKFNTFDEKKNYPPVICLIDSSEWTNVIITAGDGSKSMHINGVECAESQEAETADLNPSNNVRIAGNFFGIDDIKMWNRDFSPENALAAFQGNDPSGIVVKYSFGELEGDFGPKDVVRNEIPLLPRLLEEFGTPSFVAGHLGTTGLNLKIEEEVKAKVKSKHSEGLKKLLSQNEITLSFFAENLKDLSIQKKTGDDGFVIFGNANRIKFKVGKKPAVVCDINPQIDSDIREEEIHVAVTARRNGDAIVYINGVECVSGDAGPAKLNAGNNLRMRGEGIFDEIKVHGVVLSEDEIKREAGVMVDVEVSVATLKNTYIIGEQIMLTDPPDNNYQVGVVSKDSRIKPEYDGHIIAFTDPSTLEKRKELEVEEKRRKNAERRVSAVRVQGAKRAKKIDTNKEINEVVEEYAEDMRRETRKKKEEVLARIDKIKKDSYLSSLKAKPDLFKRFFSWITGNVVNEETEIIEVKEFKIFNGLSIKGLTEDEVNELAKMEGIRITRNYKLYTSLIDSVPVIRADQVWSEGFGGDGVKIAIIDTGVDYTHPDFGGCTTEEFLEGNCEKVVGGYDFGDNDLDPMDEEGHGTHVAAIAAGDGVANGIILKGVAPDAKIYAYKVSDSKGDMDVGAVVFAIERSIDLNENGIPCENDDDSVDVISLSLGGQADPNIYDEVAEFLNDAALCTIPVAAAGNCGPEPNPGCRVYGYFSIDSPGTASEAITVGAVNNDDEIAGSSSRGFVSWTDKRGKKRYLIKPDVVAPGVNICAAQGDSAYAGRECLDNEHVSISGTSMAAPHVSGAIALIKQAHPEYSYKEIKMALKNTAKPFGSIFDYGYGRIDVLDAIKLKGRPSIAEIETSGTVYGFIDIIGTATGEDFSYYKLYYRDLNSENREFKFYKSNNIRVVKDILVRNFDTNKFSEGTFDPYHLPEEAVVLLLEVYNKFGEISTYQSIIIRERPQSKIDNFEDISLGGNLVIKLLKGIPIAKSPPCPLSGCGFIYNDWEDIKTVIDEQIQIPSNGLVKLDTGLDGERNRVYEGFNNLDVSLDSVGKYKVQVSFETSEQIFEDEWIFDIV